MRCSWLIKRPTSKWALLAVIILAGLFSALPSYAGIWDFFKNPGVELKVADPFVEMHTGPGRGYPVFHVIEKGQLLSLIKRRGDWFKTSTSDGIEGWVSRKELTKTLGPEDQPVDFSNPDWGDYVDRRWEFGFLGGNLEDADALTTYVGFHLTQNISLEAKHTQTFSAVGNNKLIAANITHQPFPRWYVSPFITLGSGEVDINPNTSLVQSERRTNFIYTVGSGAMIYVSRQFLMRLEYNKHTLLTQREENEEIEEWKAGFSVFF